MPTLRDVAEEFLSHRRLAVAGVSRDSRQPANLIYRRLRAAGHEVFAVNPNADHVEGDRCFPSVAAIPGPVDGVVVVTTPEVSEEVVADCAAAGVPREGRSPHDPDAPDAPTPPLGSGRALRTPAPWHRAKSPRSRYTGKAIRRPGPSTEEEP